MPLTMQTSNKLSSLFIGTMTPALELLKKTQRKKRHTQLSAEMQVVCAKLTHTLSILSACLSKEQLEDIRDELDYFLNGWQSLQRSEGVFACFPALDAHTENPFYKLFVSQETVKYRERNEVAAFLLSQLNLKYLGNICEHLLQELDTTQDAAEALAEYAAKLPSAIQSDIKIIISNPRKKKAVHNLAANLSRTQLLIANGILPKHKMIDSHLKSVQNLINWDHCQKAANNLGKCCDFTGRNPFLKVIKTNYEAAYGETCNQLRRNK